MRRGLTGSRAVRLCDVNLWSARLLASRFDPAVLARRAHLELPAGKELCGQREMRASLTKSAKQAVAHSKLLATERVFRILSS